DCAVGNYSFGHEIGHLQGARHDWYVDSTPGHNHGDVDLASRQVTKIAGPPDEGEWDKDGCFHTLEWRLKKRGESCRFYQNGRCSVYPDRPMLCRTYPFYLDGGVLVCSECRGQGGRIGSNEADKMAEQLILRYLFEIQEAIALLERYRDFERGEARKGVGCIVHDSEGEHRIVGGELLR
ncbi:MAG: hypothetical protein HGA93_03990, partial [Methanothrix sp.]|nr:hypothetical protein [Methanothrix sp.]